MTTSNNQDFTQCAVLWDLDGTLIESAPYHWLAWNDELIGRYIPFSPEMFSVTFGKRNDTILRLLVPDISDAEIQLISDSKEARYRHHVVKNGLSLLAGAEYWLSRLKASGWKQSLATMTSQINVQAIFSVTPLGRYLDAVASGDEVRLGKPAPDIFLCAAQKLGVPPERCIVVEDSPAGIEAARLAGMKSIGVNHQSVLCADLYVKSLDLLPEQAFQSFLRGEA